MGVNGPSFISTPGTDACVRVRANRPRPRLPIDGHLQRHLFHRLGGPQLPAGRDQSAMGVRRTPPVTPCQA